MIDFPRIAIKQRAVIGTDLIEFDLQLADCRDPDLVIVIDVYDLDQPVHPQGHVGWWKFACDHNPVVSLRRAEAWQVSLGTNAELGRWVNPDAPPTSRLLVNAVLRSIATNALVDLDTVPVLPDDASLLAFRSALNRDWSLPRFAPAPYFLPDGVTVHLVAPNVFLRDGVGNLCLDTYRLLKQNGIPVRLHAGRSDLSLSDIVEPQRAMFDAVEPGHRLLYFFSTYDPYLQRIAELPVTKLVYFHGVTSPEKLRVFDPELSVAADKALKELRLLKAFDRFAANSRASAEVLAAATGNSIDHISIVPPKLASPLEGFVRSTSTGRRMLTVCQISPHKKVEDVLRLFAACHGLNADWTCRIVGRVRSRSYADYLHWVERQELGLPEGAVIWAGSVSDEELAIAYADASSYVSMSEDEGFCLPLVEAMRHRVPVLAFGIPAVLETLGGSGITFSTKEFEHLAYRLEALLSEEGRLAAVLDSQAQRAASLMTAMHGREIFELLAP